MASSEGSSPARPPFRVVSVENVSPSLVLATLEGELDAAGTDAFLESLLPAVAPGVELVLHVAGLVFIDSTGVGALLDLLRRVQDAGGELVLYSPSPQLDAILTMTALDKTFKVVAG
jgi:anti-sigma B factor antagonist